MTGGTAAAADPEDAGHDGARPEPEPLLKLAPLEAFLDDAGLGAGPLDAEPIGDGHSNVTYLVRRGALQLVLRRPPRGPLSPSAHDVVREARLLRALRPAGVRVPEVLAICDTDAVIGAPFYVMAYLDGDVVTETLPARLDHPDARHRIGLEVVEALAEVHAVDVERAGLSALGRPSGYLERQVRRFRGLFELNATRPLPELDEVGEWLTETMPQSPPTTLVHGDYRLGNVMLSRADEPRVSAILDWELATLGDPLADLGYLMAMWAEPGDGPNPMLDLSSVTRSPGFPDRAALGRHYAEVSGHSLDTIEWYQVLAVWKAAIFLEGSYKRYLAGTTDDEYFARLGEGVPLLARYAWEQSRQAGA
jgi:aminoglycoside phosphotransferase (APT) family kinase protein